MSITLGHYLTVGAILFALSVIGIFLEPQKPDRAC
jgi:NADH:ubiquinone oxidoreductase subunit K